MWASMRTIDPEHRGVVYLWLSSYRAPSVPGIQIQYPESLNRLCPTLSKNDMLVPEKRLQLGLKFSVIGVIHDLSY